VAGGVHDGERDDAAADEVLTGRDGHRVTVRGRVDGARLGLRRDDLHRFAGERVVGAVQDGDGDRLTLFERAEVTVLHAGQRTVRGNDAGDDGAGHRVVDRVGDRDPDVVLGIGRGVGGGGDREVRPVELDVQPVGDVGDLVGELVEVGGVRVLHQIAQVQYHRLLAGSDLDTAALEGGRGVVAVRQHRD